jgi:hypothetical protein
VPLGRIPSEKTCLNIERGTKRNNKKSRASNTEGNYETLLFIFNIHNLNKIGKIEMISGMKSHT